MSRFNASRRTVYEDALAAALAPLPILGASRSGQVALIGLIPLYASLARGYNLEPGQAFLTANLAAAC